VDEVRLKKIGQRREAADLKLERQSRKTVFLFYYREDTDDYTG